MSDLPPFGLPVTFYLPAALASAASYGRRDPILPSSLFASACPNGDINLDSLFGSIDAAAPLQPGDAFTGLEGGDSSIGADAFSIGGFTLDPTLAAGGEGFDPVGLLSTSPPLLDIGGGTFSAALSITRASTSTAAPVLAPPTSGPLAPARM